MSAALPMPGCISCRGFGLAGATDAKALYPAARSITPGPFLYALAVLIAIPLALAAAAQMAAYSNKVAGRAVEMAGLLPVPATSVVLFVVVAAIVPQLGQAMGSVA